MNLGIMGGTFDPVHLGHLWAAEAAREALGLEEVAFVPAGRPPHRAAPAASALDRFAMVALATAAHPRFSASDLELRREGPSYTFETLEALRAERPRDRLVLIVGSDTFPEMQAWRERDRVFALCEVAVVHRPGTAVAAGAGAPRRVHRVETAGLPLSAREVRQRLGQGLSVRYWVPETVADYIQKRGLYRSAGAPSAGREG
jgi:nicotinate-nucleotide adenylyltransferase